MSTPIVEQIKDKLSIVDVVSSYVKLERAGANFKAKCPFHSERTPSFMISPARNSYHCFGCGKGGDIISFVQEIEGLDFIAALKLLAERAGVKLDERARRDGSRSGIEQSMLYDVLEEATRFYESELRKSSSAIEYLKSRGITGQTAKTFRIGFAPDGWENLVSHLRTKGWKPEMIEKAGLSVKGRNGPYDRFRNRIMFPIASAQGKPIAFTGRIMPGGDDQMGKYVNSPETELYHKSSVLYGLDLAKQAILKLGYSIIVEGQMDAIMVRQAGYENVVAISGTALTENHLRLIRRFSDHIIFCFDNDQAGQNALRKAAALSFELGLEVKAVSLGDSGEAKDPADIIGENPEAWQKALTEARPVIDHLIGIIKSSGLGEREEIKRAKSEILPLMATLSGNMEQSHYIKKVSESFGIPENAVRADLDQIARKASDRSFANRPNENREERETSPPVSRTALEAAAERVVGFEKVFRDRLDLKDMRQKFIEALKVPIESFTAQLPDDRLASLTLEAELYYGGNNKLDKIADELTSAMLLAYYEESLARTLREMREAEQKGEGSKAAELYVESKDLGEKIYHIKNNRLTTEL